MALPLLLGVLCGFVFSSNAASDDSFKAAVFEHARQGTLNTTTAEEIVKINLDYYKRAAAVAKSKGAKLILFPEYGIFPPVERLQIKSFLEYIPDPNKIRANPCNEGQTYEKRPILYELSCMAKYNDLVVVANTGDIQTCLGEAECPEDGVYHLNTNVVFDKDGTLIHRYHKEYLFFETGMDLPKEEHNPVFKTDLGTFATFICFDILFKRAAEVSRRPDIDAVLFSTLWMDSFSFSTSVQYFQSWAIGNNVTFLASNLNIPGHGATGSGIFNGKMGSVIYTNNPDGVSKLVVGEVPRKSSNKTWKSSDNSVTLITKTTTMKWQEDFEKEFPKECSFKKLNHSKNIFKEYRCWKESLDNYTLVKLTGPKGHAKVCNNDMCCHLNYATNGLKEHFYLGVFNGTHNSFNRYFWAEEHCFLSRCDVLDGDRCDSKSKQPQTRFHYVNMAANFTTKYVYPAVLTSNLKLLPVSKWKQGTNDKNEASSESFITFESSPGIELVVANLKGRNYDRDPPYKR